MIVLDDVDWEETTENCYEFESLEKIQEDIRLFPHLEGLTLLGQENMGADSFYSQTTLDPDNKGTTFLPGGSAPKNKGTSFLPRGSVPENKGTSFLPVGSTSGNKGTTFLPGESAPENKGTSFLPGELASKNKGTAFLPGGSVSQNKGITFLPGGSFYQNKVTHSSPREMPPEKRAKYYESKDKMLTMAAYHSPESLRATDPRNILEPSKKEKHILELKKEKEVEIKPKVEKMKMPSHL